MAPLIVGAGPAGCAAAIMLARAGASPLIREQTSVTGDALCGGFLSWRTRQSLDALGIDAAALGGHKVTRVVLYSGHRSASAPLPAPGIGLSRRHLDTVMLARAMDDGARIERGIRLLAVESDGTARFDHGEAIDPDSLFFANGKHDVRGLPRREARSGGDLSIGIRLRLGPHPALTEMIGDRIELHLFDRGYGGLILQEDGTANLCMAVRKSALATFGGQPLALLDHLASRDDP
ncbi:MAG: FAD-dependent monooxygenase, partial [Sphingomicrobium sp.]